MWLIWLFLAIPIIEIALFIQVGGWIGLWPVLALVVLTAILGFMVMRSQGPRAWQDTQRSLAELRDPTRPLAHGALLMLAGLLMVVPGFFTDAIGLLLLIPAMRELAMRLIARRIKVTRMRMEAAAMRRDPHRPPYGDGVIDGEFHVPDDEAPPSNLPPDLPPELPHDPTRPPRGSGWTRH